MGRTIPLSVAPALAVLLLAACGDAGELTGPDDPEPRFHRVEAGDGPDGDYSHYFVDFQLVGDFWVKVAQEWSVSATSTECPENDGGHADGDPPPPAEGDFHPARGSGYVSLRTPSGWRSGVLWVTGACWFDEWNGEGGFPESAWIAGWALVGWRFRTFRAKLVSNGFPAEDHETRLDEAAFELSGAGGAVPVVGELHHEDGTTLIR